MQNLLKNLVVVTSLLAMGAVGTWIALRPQLPRGAGFTDGEITEIVANVAVNIFTNYFNHVARTDVDFPRVTVTLPVAVAHAH